MSPSWFRTWARVSSGPAVAARRRTRASIIVPDLGPGGIPDLDVVHADPVEVAEDLRPAVRGVKLALRELEAFAEGRVDDALEGARAFGLGLS